MENNKKSVSQELSTILQKIKEEDFPEIEKNLDKSDWEVMGQLIQSHNAEVKKRKKGRCNSLEDVISSIIGGETGLLSICEMMIEQSQDEFLSCAMLCEKKFQLLFDVYNKLIKIKVSMNDTIEGYRYKNECEYLLKVADILKEFNIYDKESIDATEFNVITNRIADLKRGV